MELTEKILVVDDEKSICFALKTYFVKSGHLVHCAGSADEALRLLAENTYSVALLDIHLNSKTDADGLRVASFIRRQSPSTIIVVLTALDSAEAQRRAAEVGVHSFLNKPVALAHVADVAFGLVRGQQPASAQV